MNMEYLSLIYRNDLNLIYVKGYMRVPIERTIEFSKVDGDRINGLLNSVSPFQYTSEYLFIVFKSLKPVRLKRGVKSVDYTDVCAIIPLDEVAMEELKISLNRNIRLEEPRWSSEVEDFSQEVFMENMRRGAVCCLKMLNQWSPWPPTCFACSPTSRMIGWRYFSVSALRWSSVMKPCAVRFWWSGTESVASCSGSKA